LKNPFITPDDWTYYVTTSALEKEEKYKKKFDEDFPRSVPYNRTLAFALRAKLELLTANDLEAEEWVNEILPDIPFDNFIPLQPTISHVLHLNMVPEDIQPDEGWGAGVRPGVRYIYSNGTTHYVLDTLYHFREMVYTLFSDENEASVQMSFSLTKYENNECFYYCPRSDTWDDIATVMRKGFTQYDNYDDDDEEEEETT
jgi:hypothetical protein